MNRVALLFSNADYATALARAVESVGGYKVDVISHIPIRERIAQVLPGNYDLLVADEPIGNGPFAATLARLARTPLALVFRGWADLTNDHGEWSALRDRSIAARTRFSIGAADGLFVLSDVTRDRLAARYSVDRALTVGRPIDVDYYRSGTTPSTATLTALTVTNFRYEGKFEGVKTVLDGLEPAFETHEEFRYRIAGSGRYLPVLREYVSTHPFTERIDVLGRRSDVPDLLSAADLFVYVSYLDAYPTVVLEAQAEGLPVIGGNAVGVPAAVGPAGHVPPATPMGIETAVGRVLGDDAFRATLARRSTARMDVYNAHIARRYAAAFETLIDRDETVSDAVLPSLEPGLQPGPDPEPVVTSDTSAGMASVTASAPETPSVVDSSAASEGGRHAVSDLNAAGRSGSSPSSQEQEPGSASSPSSLTPPPPPPVTAVTNRRVRYLLDAIPQGGSILDLGCVQHDATAAASDDWVHTHCYRIGDEVLGVDYLAEEVEQLARRGYRVERANVETMALGRRFDTIVAGELIEHLSNVGATLDRCHEHLREEGVLVLTTPNPWAFHRFKQASFGEVTCSDEHTCWFDERTLREVLTRHGFAVERIDYVPPAEPGITKLLASAGFRCLGGTSLLVRARKD